MRIFIFPYQTNNELSPNNVASLWQNTNIAVLEQKTHHFGVYSSR
jgi:hypothetical protein